MEITVELILGILGTSTGVLGLIIHFVRLRREKPNLHVEVEDCRHFPVPRVKQTQLRIRFNVHNRGDRATQLNSLELETYQLAKNLEKSAEAHKSVKEDCYFALPVHIEDDKLECSLALHHTHGEKKFGVTSEKTSKTLSKAGVGVL